MTTAATPVAAAPGTFQILPIDQVDESTLNTRRHFDAKSLDELAGSIRTHGVLTPILVRPKGKRFEIAAGARRIRSAKKAKLAEIPAIVREMDDVRFLEVITIENLQREDVHPLDEALGYKALIEKAGYDPQQIADRIGKSLSYVYTRMQLAKLIPPIQKLFQAEKITASHAVLIARLQPADQEKVLKSALFARTWVDRSSDDPDDWDGDVQITTTVSVRALEAWIQQNILLDLHAAPWKKDDATLYPQAGPCTTCPKRAGNQPALFPDVKKGDICTDPACFAIKLTRFIDRKRAELAGASKRPVLLLSTNWSTKRKDAVDSTDWEKVDGKPCSYATKGVIIDGRQVGQVLTVCADSKCKVHHDFSGGIQRTAANQAQRRQAVRKRKIELLSRARIAAALVEKITDRLSGKALAAVAASLVRRLHHEGSKWVCESLGLKPGKERWGGWNADRPILERIPKMNDVELNRLIARCAIADEVTLYNTYGYGGRRGDLELARALKVNVEAIKREVEKEQAAKTTRTAKMNGAKARSKKSQTSARKVAARK